MSSYNEPKILCKKANVDLSAKQYHFAKNVDSTDGQNVTVSVAGDKSPFVIMNIAKQGEDVEVAGLFGGGLLKVAAAVKAGDSLKPNADGAGIVAVAGDIASAIAQADGASGDVISVDVIVHSIPAAP